MKPSHESRLVATKEAFINLQQKQLLKPFLTGSAVGFAIFDEQLRYQAINSTLAATSRLPAEAHLNRSLRQVLGEMGLQVETVFERVLVSGKPVLKEVVGRIPTRTEVVHCIGEHFPVRDAEGKVRRLGAMVVEVTEQKALQQSMQVLAQRLPGKELKEQRRAARELHEAIVRYHTALKRNLSFLVRPIWQLGEDRMQLLEHSVELLELFPIVTLSSPTTKRNVFQQLGEDSKLGNDFFVRIANNPELQREMLDILAKYPDVRNDLMNELSRTFKFRRWLLGVARRKMKAIRPESHRLAVLTVSSCCSSWASLALVSS